MARTLRTGAVVLLCLLIGVAGVMAVGSPVAAQDDDGGVPSLPALYHGDLTVSDGSVTEPVVVDVVADGEIQDSITTDADGSIGGPAANEAKLEVQEPDETDVEFHIAGSPVTIVSVDGESVNSDSIDFDSGVQEIMLEADAADLEPAVDLEITSAPDTVEEGDAVAVDVEIENTGAVPADQDVELLGFDESTLDSTSFDLPVGESTTTTLTWDTSEGDAGNGTLTVRTGDATATHSLTIERVSPPAVAQPSPGGATDEGDDETELPEGVAATDEQTLVYDAELGLSQVRFTNATDVESVTWSDREINGTVTATAYTTPPETVGAAPGAMLSLSQISVPDEGQDGPATVQFSLQPHQLDDVDASAEDLHVYHFADGEWTQLETTLIETDADDEIVVQAEVDHFSYFAVSAVSEPIAEFTVEPAEPDAEAPVVVDAADSTTTYGEIVAYDWMIDGSEASGETVETEFTEPGTVEIELTVENDAGETATTTQSVSVSDTTADDSDSGTTDDGIPGFSVLVTLLALLISVAAVRHRTKS